jgi:hypothetical protein
MWKILEKEAEKNPQERAEMVPMDLCNQNIARAHTLSILFLDDTQINYNKVL